MEVEDRSEGRRNGFGATFNLPPNEDGSGGASATVSASTPALVVVVVGAFGVGALLLLNPGVVRSMNQGVVLARVQKAVPALLDVGRGVAAAA